MTKGMTSVFRITRRPYARDPLSGEGAHRYGGRWSSTGTRLAYASEHVSLAMIEYLIHVDAGDPPTDLVLVHAEIPDSVSRRLLPAAELPRHWRRTPAPPELAEIGDQFACEGRFAVLIVPSVLAPMESNWLINPIHRDSGKIKLRKTEPLRYDPRFFQNWRARN